jgi:hypothetical protein
MKKGFFKALVATAVVGATMAVSGVVAMAATTVYNVGETTALTLQQYNNSALTVASDDTVLTASDSSVAITALAAGKPALVGYDDINKQNSEKKYLTGDAAEGYLAGTNLSKSVCATAGLKGVEVFKISDVPSGATVGIYYTFIDSKGAPGKAAVASVTGGKTAVDATVTDKSTSVPYYVETVSTGNDILFVEGDSSSSARIGLLAVTVTTEDAATGVVAKGSAAKTAVVFDGTNYYVVGLISKADAEAATSVSINDAKGAVAGTSTDTVYTGVSINGTDYSVADLTGSANSDLYVYGVKVTDATSSDVANLNTLSLK